MHDIDFMHIPSNLHKRETRESHYSITIYAIEVITKKKEKTKQKREEKINSSKICALEKSK